MTMQDTPKQPADAGPGLQRTVRRPLLERLERLQHKSGPYAKLIREAAEEVRVANQVAREALEMADAAKAAWVGEPRHACAWCVDDDGVWYTDCGHMWQFESGGPRENGTKFCQYCGGRISGA